MIKREKHEIENLKAIGMPKNVASRHRMDEVIEAVFEEPLERRRITKTVEGMDINLCIITWFVQQESSGESCFSLC